MFFETPSILRPDPFGGYVQLFCSKYLGVYHGASEEFLIGRYYLLQQAYILDAHIYLICILYLNCIYQKKKIYICILNINSLFLNIYIYMYIVLFIVRPFEMLAVQDRLLIFGTSEGHTLELG